MSWDEDGILLLPRFVDWSLLDAFMADWWAENGDPDYEVENLIPGEVLPALSPEGWRDCPADRLESIVNIARLLEVAVESVAGPEAALSGCSTAWVASEGSWARAGVTSAWVALDHVDPGSGVLQVVPGSHRWVSEGGLVGEVVSFVPLAGDVLVWHRDLLHRDARPEIEGSFRPGLVLRF